MDVVRMGKNVNELITGEIELLSYLTEKCNIITQKVKRNKFGNAITILNDKTPVTVLEWLDGDTLDNIKITKTIAFEIGTMIGKMHNDLKNLKIKNRYNYDESLLSSMIEEMREALKQRSFNEKQTP